MTAGHYIGLLLLSTAAVGSPEHVDIVAANSAGIWLSLSELQLVERENEQALWTLTERGRVLVRHILELPLPEQVMAWKMPGGPMTLADMDPDYPIINSLGRFAELRAAREAEEAPSSPRPPNWRPGETIPDDPEAKRAKATELLNAGYGLNEVANIVELPPDQVEAIFYQPKEARAE